MQKELPSDHVYQQAAECLKALAHPKRLQLLRVMAEGRYAVGELANRIGVASHTASEHLRLLERCGFIRCEREGQSRYYRIADTHVVDLLVCMESRFGTTEE